MNKKQLKNFAKVLAQAAEGVDIQVRKVTITNVAKWRDKTDFTIWQPDKYEYRITPARPKEVWINFSGFSEAIWAYPTKEEANQQAQPDYTYDAIAVHFKEVTENEKVE